MNRRISAHRRGKRGAANKSTNTKLTRCPIENPNVAGAFTFQWPEDWLTSMDITKAGLQLSKATVLRGLRNFLRARRPELYSTDHMKGREVEKGSGRRPTTLRCQRSAFYAFPAISLGFTTFVEILRMQQFFNPTIEVATFRLRGWCMLDVFVAGIHQSRP